MTAIMILTILSILAGATLSLAGFTFINIVVAQMADNATMGNLTVGNMTGGNITGGNTTEASGTVSHVCKGDYCG
jgi:ABC-type Fe3+-siderophore transport system permease subunit